MGITGADLTPQIAQVLNLNIDHGALVDSVVPNSPADKAGIQAGDAQVSIDGQHIRAGGDVITAVDGQSVTGMDDVVSAVDSKKPGDDIQLTYLRDGSEHTVTVTLAERPAQAGR
jgi:S1-C subfamily serine protease